MTDNTNDPVGVLISALEKLAAQDSGIVASSAKSDCMAATAKAALRNYKAAAIQHSEQRETVPAAAVLSISWPMPRYRMETGYMQPDERGSWCKWIDVHPNMDSPPVAAPVPEAKAEQVGYPYQALFNSIGAAVEIQGLAKAISVKAFVNALQDEGYQITPTAPAVKHEASELPVPVTCQIYGHVVGHCGECNLGADDDINATNAVLADNFRKLTLAPPIAVQGSGDADIEFKRLADAILQAATNTERNDALRLMAALFDSRSPVAAAPEELSKAFITLESNGDGKSRKIVLKFNQRDDAYAVHHFLLNCGEGRALSAAAPSADAKVNGNG